MFSRYRRTPPTSGNGTPNKLRRSTSASDYQDPSASLAELRNSLIRLEVLTTHFHAVGKGLLEDLAGGNDGKKGGVKGEKSMATAAITTTAASCEGGESKEPSKPNFIRSPSATATDLLLSTNAHFLTISEKEEEEMVELLRRVAELVVLSERMAGQILDGSLRDSTASNDKVNGSEDNDAAALPYLALFELFCEKNALANIVNIVTGVAFAPNRAQTSRPNSSSNLRDYKCQESSTKAIPTPHLLPPLTIATQAIQSVSILIQNVSRATSLYFLLSNNRVNDLISLPIHLYKRAEMNHTHYARFAKRGAKRPQSYAGLPLPIPPSGQSLGLYSSNEIGELTTHFVSFLKSLAMRVNTETLQFFLTFPSEDGSSEEARDLMSARSEDIADMSDETVWDKLASLQNSTFPNPQMGDEIFSSSCADTGNDNSNNKTDPSMEIGYVADVQSQKYEPPTTDDAGACLEEAEEETALGRTPLHSEPAVDDLTEHGTGEDNPVRHSENEVSTSEVGDSTAEETKKMVEVGDSTTDESKEMHLSPAAEASTPPLAVSDKSIPNTAPQRSPPSKRQQVDFPLYARALEFCSSEQDSFVRVTAMNICMNMIRLATVEHDGGVAAENDTNDDDSVSESDADGNRELQTLVALPTVTPSGVLHKAPTLQMRDRVAIANYACDPRRVNDLVSPLCARLASRFGQLEGTVRLLEALGNTPTPKKNPMSKAEKKTSLSNTIHDLVANVQDELLLLDDLLRVGLISLNEQAIEMLLATFIYPMILQPLLLPLHRFSPATTDGQQQQQNDGNSVETASPQKTNPVITLQSPPPFSKNIIDRTSDVVGDGDADASSATSEQVPPNQNDLAKSYSSEDMDLAPSKTALFGITVIFHTISNSSLKHLLLTALLYPFSPPASGGAVVRTPPQITFSDGSANEMGKIRMEENELCESETHRLVPVYSFGTTVQQNITDDVTENHVESSGNLCTFILAPALVGVISKIPNPNHNSPKRLNPYRKIFLSFLGGSGEMACLQKLSIVALHSVVSTVDGWIIHELMLSLHSLDDKSNEMDNSSVHVNDTHLLTRKRVEETIECLCQSVVNKSVTYDGWWKVKFNRVAARTLLDAIGSDYLCISLASNFLTKIRLEAAHFLLSLPSRLDQKSREASDISNKNGKSNPVDKQHLETWLLDRFYFDQPTKSSKSVVEHVFYLQEHDGDADAKSQYRYGLEVLGTLSVPGASEILCNDLRIIGNNLVSDSKGNTPFHCAATWALTCLSLDALCMKLSKMKSDSEKEVKNAVAATGRKKITTRLLSFMSGRSDDDDDRSTTRVSLAHISSKLAMALLDEGDNSEDSKKVDAAPAHGSEVTLVGKSAFPCVCEISPTFASLFTGRTCVSNDGVQWQSLYLVVVGKYAVLAEPERGGSGGEGRVITSCKLACLAVKKDATVLANNNTPARRLLLQHSSLDDLPPPLFTNDSSSTTTGQHVGSEGLRLTRSRMDLWFEDSNAAGHAWKALAAKIAKARAKRGSKIRSALLASDCCSSDIDPYSDTEGCF